MSDTQIKSPAAATSGACRNARNDASNLRVNCSETPLQRLLPRLEKVQRTGKDQWIACCSGHDDRSPSLSIRVIDDGTLLLHCFAGCNVAQVVHGVGLEVRDLFPYQPRDRKPIPSQERWDHQALLKALRRESWAIVIAANQLANNRPLAEPDRQRLMQAARRIERIVGVAE